MFAWLRAEAQVWRFITEFDVENTANMVSGRYWVDVFASTGRKWYLQLRLLRGRDTDSCLSGARVYITGRRMEALENAAKTHSPSDGGQIIPYATPKPTGPRIN